MGDEGLSNTEIGEGNMSDMMGCGLYIHNGRYIVHNGVVS